MRKFVLHIVTFCFLILVTSCGISEDCFKGNGNQITQTFPLENFSKIKVYDGVGLVVKEGPNYEVKIKTSDNIIDDLEVRLDGDMLIVKDNSSCNIARDYGQTTVYVTIPDGTILPLIPELELHCKTEQKIQSDGVLHSPIVRLFSMDLSDGAGTGDFYITVDNSQLVVESNNVSNFQISGNIENGIIALFWGNGIVDCKNLDVSSELEIYHRGSNDIKLSHVNILRGGIYSTGNVILYESPQTLNVNVFYTGRLIFN